MILKTRSLNRKRRETKFSPASLNGGRPDFFLEPRTLARPYFYLVEGVGIVDQVETTADGGPDSKGLSTVSSSGSVTATVPAHYGQAAVTFSQSGIATSQIIDSAYNGAGTNVISMSATQVHFINVTSNPYEVAAPNGGLRFGTTASGNRTYRLADDAVVPGPVTLTQTLSFTIGVAFASGSNTSVAAGMNFSGYGFTASAFLGGYQLTHTAGTTVTTSTTNGAGASTFNLTATTYFAGGLPRDPGGLMVPVNYGTTTITTIMGGSAGGQTNLSLNYSAHF